MPRSRPAGALHVGERVFLRRPRAADRDEFLRLNRASRSLHHPWISAPTTARQFQEFMERAARDDVDSLIVCRLEDGAIAGVFTLSQIFMRNFRSSYLGFYAVAPHAGSGYMREGSGLLLRHAFGRLRLHRVEANIQPGNLASIALVRSAGFRREGFSPGYLKIGGRWRDHLRFAITVEDWRRRHGRRPAS